MRNKAASLIGATAGLLLVSLLYADGVRDPRLMFFTGFTWAIGVWLIARNRDVLKTAKRRWKVPLSTLTVAVIFLGIHTGLPMPEDLRTNLMLLVLGTSWATAGLGLEIGRSETPQSTNASTTAD
jgi:hypothetical protein